MSVDPARNRYFAIVAVQLLAVIGAIMGLILVAKGEDWFQSILGGAILLSAIYVMAVVPRAMARKWRTPPDE